MKEELSSIDPVKLKELDTAMELITGKKTEMPVEDPPWVNDGKINESRFVESYLAKHPMKCVRDELYGLDGRIDPGQLGHDIYNEIKIYTVKDVAKLVKNLISVLKIEAYSPELPLDTGHIHFLNGTYCLANQSFTEKKVFCRNRLAVRYDPNAPIPEIWMKFLDGLLHTEDIYALQEFLGYCMIPTNKAQVMMCILGKGGEGKSRIQLVMSRIFGESMNSYSLEQLATDKFAKFDQIGKLLMVDDELKTEALSDTSTLKSIVTMEDKTNLEKKHSQSIQGKLFVRVLALGNGPLSSLYDKSDGFFRRQIVLQTIPRPKDRIDDPDLINKLLDEVEGITQWMLAGLHRLLSNNYKFTLSDRVKEAMKEMREDEDNLLSFYSSTGYISFEDRTTALTKDLYTAYLRWCEDNCEKPYTNKTFASRLKHDAESLGITYDRNLDASGGKRARGYRGVHVMINPYNF